MARKARVEFAGALYHVLDRGDRREVIFRDEADRARFLETLGEACGRTGWRVHAYVLMSNHCHLMIETPQANLVAGMRWLLDGAGEKLRVRRAVDAPVRRSHGEDEARRLLRRGLAWLGLEAEILASLKKGDERKLALAAVLRARTSVPNAWIAQELQLGHVSRVSRCGREKPQSETLAARLLTALAK